MDTSPKAEVWVVHKRRVVLVQEQLGPPADVIVWSDGTVGGTYFSRDAFLGSFPLPDDGWGEALVVAEARARELGYTVERGG
jgi:hypothetical protein